MDGKESVHKFVPDFELQDGKEKVGQRKGRALRKEDFNLVQFRQEMPSTCQPLKVSLPP